MVLTARILSHARFAQIARGVGAPVIHVNGDDIEAVIRAFQVSLLSGLGLGFAFLYAISFNIVSVTYFWLYCFLKDP